ncbi:hypothetical protein D9M68_663620 [compost metagenome]
MKMLFGLGKALSALFWGVVLANLIDPFAQPFALLLYLAGALLLLIHGVELLLFHDRLDGRAQPSWERAQIMLFGIFHLLSLPPSPAPVQPVSDLPLEAGHA